MSKLIRRIKRLLTGCAPHVERAPRLEVELGAQFQPRLLLSISLPPEEAGPWQPLHPTRLIGSTLNISESGLAVLVPSLSIGNSRLDQENLTVHVMLDIYPAGVVEMEGEVVRWAEYKVKEGDVRYLIGMRIKRMSEGESERYLSYLALPTKYPLSINSTACL